MLSRLRAPLKGQGLVEYALILLLVSIVVVTALGLFGDQLDATFRAVVEEFPG